MSVFLTVEDESSWYLLNEFRTNSDHLYSVANGGWLLFNEFRISQIQQEALPLPSHSTPLGTRLFPIAGNPKSEDERTLKARFSSYNRGSWEVEFDIPPMILRKAREWATFLLRLNNEQHCFLLRIPNSEITGALGDEESYRVAFLDNKPTGMEVLTSGWPANTVEAIHAGQWCSIDGFLHNIVKDVTSDENGHATIQVWPPLKGDLPIGTVIEMGTTVRGVFRLYQVAEFDWSPDMLVESSLQFRAFETKELIQSSYMIIAKDRRWRMYNAHQENSTFYVSPSTENWIGNDDPAI